ncbi:MAG: hypothetical protein PW788_12005 [Micavibrio sp.]|nr:hypothetical protein [Micavibrio sp.]
MWLKNLFKRTSAAPRPPKPPVVFASVPSKQEMNKFRDDCAEGRNDGVRDFLDKYSGNYADYRGKSGWSPLMLAVWRGQADTVALLHKARQNAHNNSPKR